MEENGENGDFVEFILDNPENVAEIGDQESSESFESVELQNTKFKTNKDGFLIVDSQESESEESECVQESELPFRSDNSDDLDFSGFGLSENESECESGDGGKKRKIKKKGKQKKVNGKTKGKRSLSWGEWRLRMLEMKEYLRAKRAGCMKRKPDDMTDQHFKHLKKLSKKYRLEEHPDPNIGTKLMFKKIINPRKLDKYEGVDMVKSLSFCGLFSFCGLSFRVRVFLAISFTFHVQLGPRSLLIDQNAIES